MADWVKEIVSREKNELFVGFRQVFNGSCLFVSVEFGAFPYHALDGCFPASSIFMGSLDPADRVARSTTFLNQGFTI